MAERKNRPKTRLDDLTKLVKEPEPIPAAELARVRTNIPFGPGRILEAARLTEAALYNASRRLFQRGGYIVTPTMIKGKSFHGVDTVNPGIKDLTADDLLGHIDEVVAVTRLDRKEATKPIPPRELVTAVLRLGDQLTLPVLRGMVHTPLVRGG
jgi:hypothetical protein